MPLVGFEPKISAGERPQTYALDRTATGIGRAWQAKYVRVVLKDEVLSYEDRKQGEV
jgi:hypothetical protein